MQIKNVKIKNLKSIGGQILEVDFTNGLHLINGDVGTGKTTVFTAIVYALFNKNTDFKGNSKTTLPINKLINDINKKELLVEVLLDNGYLIKRGQKPDIFEIWKDGLNLANKSVTIDQDFLEQTVLEGLTFDIFLSTVYLSSKPGSIPFLHMSQSQRKEYIEKILDLRRIFYYNENLKKFIAENKLERLSLDKEKILLTETITNEEFNIQQQYKKQEQQKQKLQEYTENHEQKLNTLKLKLKKLEDEKQTIEILLEKAKEKIPEELTDNLKIEIEKLEDEIKLIEDTDYDIVNNEELELKNTIERLTKLKHDLNFEIEMTETDIKTKDEELLKIEEIILNEAEKDINELKTKIQKLKDLITHREAEYTAYINSKENYHFCGTCPTLSKIIGSYDVKNFEEFKTKADETLKNLDEQLNEREKTLLNIKMMQEHNRRIEDEKTLLKNKLIELNAKLTTIKSKIEETTKRAEQYKENRRKTDELKIENLKQKIKTIKNDIENIHTKYIETILSDINNKENEIKSTKELFSTIENEPKPEVSEVNTDYLETLKLKMTELMTKIDDEYNKSIELEELKKEINSPEHKAKAIKKYMPIFEDKLNEILDKFMEDDVFDLVAKLDDEFELTFYKNGKEVSVFSLSSGQVACCSLACTFAFLNLLETKHQTRFNHLLIDELLDLNIGTRIVKVLDYLKQISTNKNISVISHNKTLDTGLFDTITYVSKTDLFSEYSVV